MTVQLSKIRDVVREAAVRILGAEAVEDIQVTESQGFFGEEIVRARIVIPDRPVKFSGDALFELVGSVTQSVKRMGEQRRVTLEYADIAELEQIGDH